MSKKRLNKVIKGKACEDDIGKYIPYCEFKHHVGVIRYAQYRTCEKKDCRHYVKYREERE